MATLKVGGDVDTPCSRCNLTLAHVIVAMNGTRPVRVLCKTCKTEHAFRSTDKKAKAARKSPGESRRVTATANDYDKMMTGKDLSRAKRYEPKVAFAEGEVVDHKVFGLGLVTRVLTDGKIEVLFKVGPKVLLHAR